MAFLRRTQYARMTHTARGFTLIEVLMATALVAIAVVGVMGAIRSVASVEAKQNDADIVQNLACEKLDEMRILANPNSVGLRGDFADRGHPEVSWTADVVDTDYDGLEQITITASLGHTSQSISTLINVQTSASSTSSSSTSGGAGQ
jgi:type II secretion system protein I